MQIIHYDAPKYYPGKNIQGAVNSRLARDIRVLNVAGVDYTTLAKDESCCGLPLYLLGSDEFESQAAPEEDIVAETITEELTRTDKSDIKKMIAKEIEATLKSKNFKDKVSDEVSKDVKKNKELEKVVVEITRNVVTQLYKVLWMRRTFWRNSLKNTPA